MDTQIDYKPASGERWPFLRARLDLCETKCARLNVSATFQLEAAAAAAKLSPINKRQAAAAAHSGARRLATSFHCDRDPYALVSKRRLCGKL